MDEAVDTHRDSSGQAPMARVGDVSGDAGRWMGRSLTVAMSKVTVSSRLQDKGLCRLSENDLGSKEKQSHRFWTSDDGLRLRPGRMETWTAGGQGVDLLHKQREASQAQRGRCSGRCWGRRIY